MSMYHVCVMCLRLLVSRSDLAELKSSLFDLGATEVVTEEFCNSHQMTELVQVRPQFIPRPSARPQYRLGMRLSNY